MKHVREVDEFAKADNLPLLKVDALEPSQEILRPIETLVAATSLGNADRIIRTIRIIDLNPSFVIARLELSEPEGESPLLNHVTRVFAVQQIVYSHEGTFWISTFYG